MSQVTKPPDPGADRSWWSAHQDGPLEQVVLRDGSAVWIGPLLKVDREPIAEWYDTLSAQSKRRRFLADQEHLDAGLLDYLVDGVDGVDHVAVVALADDDGLKHLVGVARLVRLREPSTAADVAVTVDDAWQGRGLATAMLAVLVPRRPLGVTSLHTEVARGNAASLAMLAGVGPLRTVSADRGVLEVEITLPEPSG